MHSPPGPSEPTSPLHTDPKSPHTCRVVTNVLAAETLRPSMVRWAVSASALHPARTATRLRGKGGGKARNE